MNTSAIFAQAKESVVRLETEDGRGSGIIIDKKGIIITNRHIVDFEYYATVILYDGRIDIGRVIFSNRIRDIAFLWVNLKKLSPALLNYSSDIQIGEEVVVIGHPRDFPYSVTTGIVSYPKRIKPNEPGVPYIQYDASTNPGSSGGPIINSEGKIIGMVSGGFGETLNLAIPVYDIKSELLNIKKHFDWYKTAKYCYICGNANSHSEKFCEKCGVGLISRVELNGLIKEKENRTKEKTICRNCMNINPKEDVLCDFCGGRLVANKLNDQEGRAKKAAEQTVCPICRKLNRLQTRWCSNCGFDLWEAK